MVNYQSRMRVVVTFVIIVSVIFFVRLFYLQVLTQKYKKFAENNALQRRTIYPPRGLIYDRNNKLLVSNEVVYDLMVIPNQVRDLDTNELCRILQINREDFTENMITAKEYSGYRPSVFIKNLSIANYGVLQERLYEFRGFFVQPRTIRKYQTSSLAHVLGYIGEVNENQIAKSDGYYHQGDYIGISGLEDYYEEELRGTNGVKYILVDAFNNEQGTYNDGEMDKESESGYNLMSGIDINLQEYAEKLMANKKGSIVALDPQTGEILVMVSFPTYDPSLLTGRERSENYKKLLMDADKPLFNRAISAMYPPGSTFKTVMASIGQQDGVLFPQTMYSCPGGYFIGNLRIGCHAHYSPLDLHDAIVHSCNTYFCNVFRSVIDQKKFATVEEGFNDWRLRVGEFGIGHRLGLDMNPESPGILPTVKRYDRIYGHRRWRSSNILSLAIGQAEISLTPLQLANLAAIFGNRGYYYQPHLVRSFVKDGYEKKPVYKKIVVHINPDYMNVVADAMFDVVNFGTATVAKVDSLFICGKTGTAQNPHGKDHSIFIAFAPKDHPRIAIAVVIENAGFGATWAAPIASLLIQQYLKGNVPKERKWLEEAVIRYNLVQQGNSNAKSDTTKNGQK